MYAICRRCSWQGISLCILSWVHVRLLATVSGQISTYCQSRLRVNGVNLGAVVTSVTTTSHAPQISS